MEDIIKCAIKGGFMEDATFYTHLFPIQQLKEMVLRPLFWQALGKSCGWANQLYGETADASSRLLRRDGTEAEYHAMKFYALNLTEGWDSAISYLTNLIKS